MARNTDTVGGRMRYRAEVYQWFMAKSKSELAQMLAEISPVLLSLEKRMRMGEEE
tara:strand:- start:137 stop:301 length:165 start_codon:yes stop_codon:yes gene_type:complete